MGDNNRAWRTNRDFHASELAVETSDLPCRSNLEGQPALNVEQRLRWASVGGWQLDVRVYFATQHPGEGLLRAAQAELDRLFLPGSR